MAKKDSRLYIRVTVDLPNSPKFIALSKAVKWDYIEMIAYSREYLTDGFIAAPVAKAKGWATSIKTLSSNHADRPSMYAVEGGFQIRDYAVHQLTSNDVEELRLRGQKGGRPKADEKPEVR